MITKQKTWPKVVVSFFFLFLASLNANEMCLAEVIFSHKCFRELLRNNLPPQQKTFSPQSQFFSRIFLRICNRICFCQRKIWRLVMNKTLPKALTAFNNSKITQPLHNICVTVWLGIPLSKGQIIQVSTSFLSALKWVSQYWSFWAEVRVTRLLMIGLGSDERNSSFFLHKM